jgi:hypothetical protein
MNLVVRYQKLGSDKVKRGEIKCSNISHLIELLGENGYHLISYYEKSDSDVFIVPTSRRQ